ncbi:hypothetical protein FAGAP_818 [Fusarium agapanthi]|uniref:Uncharacterized protein n=1 Tax=Fusarium agapanthi TaxID=1803897 RepID=A0A9P5BKF0_9HYPO|nr:hypothetical protein FAGAP_818 [Fusarium agapanthi]
MPVPEERYRRRAITRSKNWTIKDAFHALDEEFWCRNFANNPEDFVAGVCHPLEDDPGYQFWLELNGEIRQYFHIAADFPDKKGSHHPMIRKTIDAALAAIDAFYGDRVVDVDGEQVPWEEAIPKRAEWIVDRFCSPFQGWNPTLSNAASILGLNQWLDIMAPGPETEIRPSIQGVDGPTQGDIQGDGSGVDLSEDGHCIRDEHIEKVEELEDKVKHPKEENGRTLGDLGGLIKESRWQDKQVERLRSMVAGLKQEVDQLKKDANEQEERRKKHLEEVGKLLTTTVDEIKSLKSSVLHQSPADVSSVITTGDMAMESDDDFHGNGTKPSTTQASHFKTATSTPEPRDPPSDTARGRSSSNRASPSPLGDRTYARTDPRWKTNTFFGEST